MATLTIGNQRVTIDDGFKSLSPEQQQATVEQIASELGATEQPGQPQGQLSGRRITAEAWANLPENVQNNLRAQGVTVGGEGGQHQEFGANPDDRGSLLDLFVQGTTLGWADEARGHVQGAIANLQGKDGELVRQQEESAARNAVNNFRQDHPVQAFVGEMAGAIPTALVGGGAALAGKGATLGQRAASGLLVGAGQGSVYGAGSADENKQLGAAIGGAFGGGTGLAAPYLGNWLSKFGRGLKQNSVLRQVAKNAPTSSELKTASSQLFEQATGGQPPAIIPGTYRNFVGKMLEQAQKMRLTQNLSTDADGIGLMQMAQEMADQLDNGVVVDLGDLHILRQAAGAIVNGKSNRSQAFASMLINDLDAMIRSLKPADIVGGGNPQVQTKALFDAISGWSRASKLSMVEEAIRKGQNAASGPEKGVRNALRALMNNQRFWNQLSEIEQKALTDVVQGTPGSNMLKLVGTFGFGTNQATSGTGGAMGVGMGALFGGPLGMVAAPLAGSASKVASEKMTQGLANRLTGAIATPNIPQIPQVNQAAIPFSESAMRLLGVPSAGQIPVR